MDRYNGKWSEQIRQELDITTIIREEAAGEISGGKAAGPAAPSIGVSRFEILLTHGKGDGKGRSFAFAA